ncbi:TPA: TRD@ protein-like [Bos taurus]|nr:TPA: TRD@ protein-like [Bos taurus]
MPLSSLLWVLLAFTFSGSGVAQKVTQDRPEISSQVGESATMNCQYESNWNSYNIFWYKQLPSGEMIYLIGQNSYSSNARDGRYSISFQRSRKAISLIISALNLEDSAKYFCALWELTVLEVIGKAEQKLLSWIRQKTPLPHNPTPSHPCCRTTAKIHTCRPQTRNDSPVLVSSVVWIRRFNTKRKLFPCHLEAGVQGVSRLLTVEQRPPLLRVQEGDSTNFICSFPSSSFYALHWYRWKPAKSPKNLIVISVNGDEKKQG